jgi:hypothetical protein
VYGGAADPGTTAFPPGTAPPAGQPGEAAPRKGRRGLIIGVVAGCVLLLLALAATGITIALNRTATSFSVDSCVKRKGEDAVKASCDDSAAYKVVSKVDKKESCPDQNQPFVIVTGSDGKDQVLCLRPAKQ